MKIDKCEEILIYLVGQIKSKAENILQNDAKAKNFNAVYESGVLDAYAESLDLIRIIAEISNIDIKDIGFDEEFKPYDVLSLRPQNWPTGTPLY